MIERSSRLTAPAETVWEEVTTAAGINTELSPVLRMTVPTSFRGRSLRDVPSGTHIGRSWLLLAGLVPVDYDDITVAEVGPGLRFLEQSSMLTFAHWQHERMMSDSPGGCVLTDRVSFELRRPLRVVPGLRRLMSLVVGALFSHRHRRLVARWNRESGRCEPPGDPERPDFSPE